MEIKDIIRKLQDPDTLNEGLVNLEDYENERTQALETLQNELSKANSTISTLRDTNQRLYLRVTGEQETVTEIEEIDAFEKFMGVKNAK